MIFKKLGIRLLTLSLYKTTRIIKGRGTCAAEAEDSEITFTQSHGCPETTSVDFELYTTYGCISLTERVINYKDQTDVTGLVKNPRQEWNKSVI